MYLPMIRKAILSLLGIASFRGLPTLGFEASRRPLPSLSDSFSSLNSLVGDITEMRQMSETQILETQSKAEREARILHDNYAMNALFVPVEEHSEPMPCSVVQGSIPDDLPAGAILRIGPNGALKDEGWLDGDGLIQCLVIPEDKNSRPLFSSTYVDTRGRSLERDSVVNGKRFRGTLGAAPKGLSMLLNLFQNGLDFQTLVVQKDTCNTAMARSGNRVLALMEQSPPSEIQISKDGRIQTLENMCRLDGAVKDAPVNGGSFGAHGRTDPETGERVHMSYSTTSKPFARADIFEENWQLKSSVGIDLQAPVMLHDCALTKNF